MDRPTEEMIPALLAEDKKVRYLRLCVDLSLSCISRGEVTREVAETMVRDMRRLTLSLFPDKGGTFDMIYAPRLRRAIEEAFGVQESRETGR